MARPLVARASWLLVGCGIFILSLAVGSAGAEEEPGEPPFSDATQVLAIDRMVSLDEARLTRWGRGEKLPRDLTRDDFRVLVDGEERTVVGLEEIRRRRAVGEEEWRVVILVDATFSSTRTLRRGCDLVATLAEELTDLGDVTMALARPEPLRILEPTRDAGRLEEMASRLSLVTEGDDAVRAARWEWIEAGVERAPAVRASRAEVEEVRKRLGERRDFLGTEASGIEARRAVLWIADGFDVEPGAFYGVSADGAERASGEGAPSWAAVLDRGALFAPTRDFTRRLAADGWIVATLRPPKEDPFRGKAWGWRIGKWKIIGPSYDFPGILAVHEAERDPELADAHLELGDQHLARGAWEDAAEAYDRAFYHYWGDPATRTRQAEAMLGLAEALQNLARDQQARRALHLASRLDPELTRRRRVIDDEAAVPTTAAFVAPEVPPLLLAEATSGAWVRSRDELESFLDDLRRRVRLTFQVAIGNDPTPRPVRVLYRGRNVPTPRWIRTTVGGDRSGGRNPP